MFAHWWELALILILALVFFGPKRLPEIGGAMGKGIREFRKATELDDRQPGPGSPEKLTPPASQPTETTEAKTKEATEA